MSKLHTQTTLTVKRNIGQESVTLSRKTTLKSSEPAKDQRGQKPNPTKASQPVEVVSQADLNKEQQMSIEPKHTLVIKELIENPQLPQKQESGITHPRPPSNLNFPKTSTSQLALISYSKSPKKVISKMNYEDITYQEIAKTDLIPGHEPTKVGESKISDPKMEYSNRAGINNSFHQKNISTNLPSTSPFLQKS